MIKNLGLSKRFLRCDIHYCGRFILTCYAFIYNGSNFILFLIFFFLMFSCKQRADNSLCIEILKRKSFCVLGCFFYFFLSFFFKYRGNGFSVVVNLMSFHHFYYSVNCNRKHAVLKNSPTDIECI